MHIRRRYLSTADVGRELGVSVTDVEILIASGTLPAFKILGEWRIDRELLEQMIDSLYEDAADPARADGHATAGSPSAAAPVGSAGRSDTAQAGRDPALPAAPRCTVPPTLTDRQRRILKLVGEAMSNAEIAANLSLEISTVKSHVSRILQRCDLRDREQLIVLAWRSGLMNEDRRRHPPVTDPSSHPGARRD